MATTGISPEMFWDMTPAEVSALFEHRQKEDERHWNHTATMVWAVLAPHQKKGSNHKPENFHPYLKQKSAISPQQFKELLESDMIKKNNERIQSTFAKKKRKSVWEVLKEKKEQGNG